MTQVKTKFKIDFFWVKFFGVIAVVFLCIGAVLQINAKFLGSAEEVKKLRAEIVTAEVSDQEQILKSELEKYKNQSEKLKAAFLSQGQLIDIFVQLDNLKNTGVITSFDFTADTPVKDKLGILGYPVTFQATGNQAALNLAYDAVSELTFLVRPIVLSIERTEGDNFVADFGGFIYTDEENSKNR